MYYNIDIFLINHFYDALKIMRLKINYNILIICYYCCYYNKDAVLM